MTFVPKGPALSVTGVTKTHAARAVKFLKDRSLLSWYNSKDRSLNAFEFKHGEKWTYEALEKALRETK